MNINNLEKILEGEPKFRLKQIQEALYKKLIPDWDEATFLSLNLREKLNLKHALWRYWISKTMPVGTNLPVLSDFAPTT